MQESSSNEKGEIVIQGSDSSLGSSSEGDMPRHHHHHNNGHVKRNDSLSSSEEDWEAGDLSPAPSKLSASGVATSGAKGPVSKLMRGRPGTSVQYVPTYVDGHLRYVRTTSGSSETAQSSRYPVS